MLKKSDYNTKVSEIEGKIPSISVLATISALAAVENEISVHKHDKYINTPELNKLNTENYAARLAKSNLVTKTDFDNKL